MMRLLLLALLTGCHHESPIAEWVAGNPTPTAECRQHYQSSPTAIDDALVRPLDAVGTSGLKVLETGTDSLNIRGWLGQHAQKSIDVQYFIFAADNVGLLALDYLVRAAERGVRVRILVDDTLAHGEPKILRAVDLHPNIDVRIYNPNLKIGKSVGHALYNSLQDFKGVNQRMHNKTFTVDGTVSIIGGRNVADEYFDLNPTFNFRDRDVLLLGKAAAQVDESFGQFWEHELAVPIADLMDQPTIWARDNFAAGLHDYSCDETHFWPSIRENIANIPTNFQEWTNDGTLFWTDEIAFFSDAPGKNNTPTMWGGGASTDALVTILQAAKKTLIIQTPYLIVSELGLGIFGDMERKGVDVTFMTNSLTSTDGIASFQGYTRHRNDLIALGIDIYESKPDAPIRHDLIVSTLMATLPQFPMMGLHAKSMLVDDEVLVISSFNLDPRSANLNTECGVVIKDAAAAQRLAHWLERERLPENAWKITADFNPDHTAPLSTRIKLFWSRLVPSSVL